MKKLLAILILFIALNNKTLAGPSKDEFLYPLEKEKNLDIKIVRLGEKLFHDKRLSRDGTVSCMTCHNLNQGGVDGLVVSLGVKQQKGDINAPTVFNVSKNTHFFWDGRAKTLEEQLDGPVTNPKEMASSWESIVEKLKKDSEYRRMFSKSFKDGINEKNIKKALVDFEKSLVLVDSPFDRFLKGDEEAISSQAKKGYKLFKGYGCVACHQGQNIGGNMFQKFGVMDNYKKSKGDNFSKADLGRFNVTGREKDKFVFRVPSLRNVAQTAPYFHDGSAKTLKEAIKTMVRFQLGREIKDKEVADIEKFLESLTGELKKDDK